MTKFVTYNIQYSKGKDEKFDIDRIAAEIRGADVIALQEVERYWRRSGDVDQVELISRHFPEYDWVYGAGVDLCRDPASIQPGKRRQFGNMLMSRTPILWSRHHLLPKYGSIGPLSIQRSVIEGVIDCGSIPLRVYSVHLTHLSSQTRLPQVDRLLKIYRQAETDGAPVCGDIEGKDWDGDVAELDVPPDAVIMGDFNCRPDSPEYTRLVGPLSDYGGRVSNPKGLIDAWTHCGHEIESGATSEVHGVDTRLDYCFVSAALAKRIKSCEVDQAASGSDHQPVWLEIDI